jgi:hypothetical protein
MVLLDDEPCIVGHAAIAFGVLVIAGHSVCRGENTQKRASLCCRHSDLYRYMPASQVSGTCTMILV